MKKQILQIVGILSAFMALVVFGANTAYATAGSPVFSQVVSAGEWVGDIVDASYVSVASPTVALANKAFSYTCQTATGTLGTATQQIYVSNPQHTSNSWSVTIAGSATGAVWDNGTTADADYDFNDAGGSGCTDTATTEADAFGGQMTIDANTNGTLAVGQDADTSLTNVSKGSSAAFVEGTTDSITLLSATADADDLGDWTLQGIDISQKIPAEQVLGTYGITLVITFAHL